MVLRQGVVKGLKGLGSRRGFTSSRPSSSSLRAKAVPRRVYAIPPSTGLPANGLSLSMRIPGSLAPGSFSLMLEQLGEEDDDGT